MGLSLLGVCAVAGVGWWMQGGVSGESGKAAEVVVRRAARLPVAVASEWGPAGGGVPGEEDRPRRPAALAWGRGGDGGGPSAGAPLTEAEVWAHYEPTREELAYRAQAIEREAERELRRLVRVLDLDEERQDRVFAALVRSSEWYHPSLQVAGSNGRPMARTRDAIGRQEPEVAPAPAEAGAGTGALGGTSTVSPLVLAELTPEEAGVYERYTSEKAAFWAGVVEDAERQLQAVP